MKRISAVVLVVAVALAFAKVMTVNPVQSEITEGKTIFLGKMGPGQTIHLDINPTVETGGIFGRGGQYDIAYAVELPSGWTAKKSKLYGNPLKVRITAPKEAEEGEYTIKIRVEDENNVEELGSVEFFVKVNVSHDIMDAELSKSKIEAGPGQPANTFLTIRNKGSAGDVFSIYVSGPSRFKAYKKLYVPFGSSREIKMSFSSPNEEEYKVEIKVVSESSESIEKRMYAEVKIKPTLKSDFASTYQGTLVFPSLEAPFHALAGIIASMLG